MPRLAAASPPPPRFSPAPPAPSRPTRSSRARPTSRPSTRPSPSRPAPRRCARASRSPSRPSPPASSTPGASRSSPTAATSSPSAPAALRVVAPDGTLSEPVAGPARGPRRAARAAFSTSRVSPGFAEDRMVYWTYAKPMRRRHLRHRRRARPPRRGRRRARPTCRTSSCRSRRRRPTNHYGSRIVLDGEGISSSPPASTSPSSERQFAQDLGKTYGKVVRVNLDGTPPADNPFAGTRGRHPRRSGPTATATSRRAALDADGRLWTVEHGPQGGDELNLHRAGHELRLAGDQLRRELRRLAGRRGHHRARGDGAAALLLGPGDRPGRHGLLRGRDVPRVAGRPPRRRAEPRARWSGCASTATPWSARSGCCTDAGPHPRRRGRPRRRDPRR